MVVRFVPESRMKSTVFERPFIPVTVTGIKIFIPTASKAWRDFCQSSALPLVGPPTRARKTRSMTAMRRGSEIEFSVGLRNAVLMDSHLATKSQVKQVLEVERIDLVIVTSQGATACLLVRAIQHIAAPSQVLINGLIAEHLRWF